MYYKFTYDNRAPIATNHYGYKHTYAMNGRWETPIPNDIPLVMCRVGYHVLPSSSLAYYASKDLWEVEIDNDWQGNQSYDTYPKDGKIVTRSIRFIQRVPTWTWDIYKTFLARTAYELFSWIYDYEPSKFMDELWRLSKFEGTTFLINPDPYMGEQKNKFPYVFCSSERQAAVAAALSLDDSTQTLPENWSVFSDLLSYLAVSNVRSINSDLEKRLFAGKSI